MTQEVKVNDGGVWRTPTRGVFVNDNGTWRRTSTIEVKTAGAWETVQIVSFPNVIHDVSLTNSGGGTAALTVRYDGIIHTGNAVAPYSVTGSELWYHGGGDPSGLYWCRMTLVGGVDADGYTPGTGVWRSIQDVPFIGAMAASVSSVKTSIIRFDLASDSAGANIVCSFNVTLSGTA